MPKRRKPRRILSARWSVSREELKEHRDALELIDASPYMMSIRDDHLFHAAFSGGARCPCCHRWVQVHVHPITRAMVSFLDQVFVVCDRRPWHSTTELLRIYSKRTTMATQVEMLRHVGLIEQSHILLDCGEYSPSGERICLGTPAAPCDRVLDSMASVAKGHKSDAKIEDDQHVWQLAVYRITDLGEKFLQDDDDVILISDGVLMYDSKVVGKTLEMTSRNEILEKT